MRCRLPVTQVSGVFLDMALSAGYPIVPVRFSGCLPVDPGKDAQRLEFPTGFTRQDLYIGSPILPESLGNTGLLERKERVCSAMNQLGPDLSVELPNPPDLDFEKRVEHLVAGSGIEAARAAVMITLELEPESSDELRSLSENLRRDMAPTGGNPQKDWLAKLYHWAVEGRKSGA